MDINKIEEGDIVAVNFNSSRSTLTTEAIVLHTPCATGDSWQFKDITGVIYYVSEGCTIGLIRKKEDNQ